MLHCLSLSDFPNEWQPWTLRSSTSAVSCLACSLLKWWESCLWTGSKSNQLLCDKSAHVKKYRQCNHHTSNSPSIDRLWLWKIFWNVKPVLDVNREVCSRLDGLSLGRQSDAFQATSSWTSARVVTHFGRTLFLLSDILTNPSVSTAARPTLGRETLRSNRKTGTRNR